MPTFTEGVRPLPCIICGKELEPALDKTLNQPSDGTTFLSHGQYGSTVWDPFQRLVVLEVNFCDTCLSRAGDEGKVFLRQELPQPSKFTFTPWTKEVQVE